MYLVFVLLEEPEELSTHDIQSGVLPDDEVTEELQDRVPHLPLRALKQVAHLYTVIIRIKGYV
jgi:hypothetical protein